jgi:hypothetical protein
MSAGAASGDTPSQGLSGSLTQLGFILIRHVFPQNAGHACLPCHKAARLSEISIPISLGMYEGEKSVSLYSFRLWRDVQLGR